MWNQLKTVLLLGSLSAVLVAIGGALGQGTLYAFTALALVMNLGAYFFSDRLVLAMHHARELGAHEAPGLHRLVGELSRAAGLPMPRLFLLPEAQPNAFATGRSPAHAVVAVTQGLLETLSERELAGVLAHELAHIAHRDTLVATIAASLTAAITSMAHALQLGALFGSSSDDEHEGQGLLVAFLAPLGATLLQLGISRSREFLADERAARLTGDPEGLARALERLEHWSQRVPSTVEPAAASLFIVNPLGLARNLAGLFSTHPSTEARVRRLRGGLANDASRSGRLSWQ